MFDLAGKLEPDTYHALARATYAEMALAGITAVGEFHYLHHSASGAPYSDPNEMGEALTAAAREAGLRITLIDTCYLRGGFDDGNLAGPQRRFADADAERWGERAALMPEGDRVRVGAAIHSVRSLDEASMKTVARWAEERAAPLHFHLSEQPAENEACLAATGRTPAHLLDDAGALGPGATAVHATHLTDDDIARLGSTATHVCLCPTTERDLADGIGPARALADRGAHLCVGTDSHAVIDVLEEARAIELDERLATQRRNLLEPEVLLSAATDAGMRSLGWDAGRIEPGMLADFIAIDTSSSRLAGAGDDRLIDAVVFCATAADVTDVVVGGEPVVEERRHVAIPDVGAELRDAIGKVAV